MACMMHNNIWHSHEGMRVLDFLIPSHEVLGGRHVKFSVLHSFFKSIAMFKHRHYMVTAEAFRAWLLVAHF